MCLITIITVNFNNFDGLQKTINSVLGQNAHNFECIVVDGGSTDFSLELLKKTKDSRFSYISEADNGIYDAMNKGIDLAKGEWVLFMNSGDVFYSNHSISRFLELSVSLDKKIKVAYGDCFLKQKQSIYKARKDVNCLKFGLSFASHQSMFFRTGLKYDLRYLIYGDLDLLSNILREYGRNAFYYFNDVVCVYEGGGISDNITSKKRIEKFLSLYRNFGVFNIIYVYFLNFGFYKKLINVIKK